MCSNEKNLLIQMSAKINGKEFSFPLTRITKKTGQLSETISLHKLPTTSCTSFSQPFACPFSQNYLECYKKFDWLKLTFPNLDMTFVTANERERTIAIPFPGIPLCSNMTHAGVQPCWIICQRQGQHDLQIFPRISRRKSLWNTLKYGRRFR